MMRIWAVAGLIGIAATTAAADSPTKIELKPCRLEHPFRMLALTAECGVFSGLTVESTAKFRPRRWRSTRSNVTRWSLTMFALTLEHELSADAVGDKRFLELPCLPLGGAWWPSRCLHLKAGLVSRPRDLLAFYVSVPSVLGELGHRLRTSGQRGQRWPARRRTRRRVRPR